MLKRAAVSVQLFSPLLPLLTFLSFTLLSFSSQPRVAEDPGQPGGKWPDITVDAAEFTGTKEDLENAAIGVR
jgi:hypothetical protein